jgi:hypothetical protein
LRRRTTTEALAGYLKNLFALLETDSARGRELLSRFVAPVVMTPETEGPHRRYRATGAFNLSFLMNAAGAAARVGQEIRVARERYPAWATGISLAIEVRVA